MFTQYRYAHCMLLATLIAAGAAVGCSGTGFPTSGDSGLTEDLFPGGASAGPGSSVDGRTDGGVEPVPAEPPADGDSDGDGAADGDDAGDDAAGGDDGFQSGTLTAGSFDDNLNFDVFKNFVNDLLQQDVDGNLPDIAVSARAVISVRNGQGEPVPDARIVVTAAGQATQQSQSLLETVTRADGRAVFLGGFDAPDASGDFTVVASTGDGALEATGQFDFNSEAWELTIADAVRTAPAQLDLAFVVDATGSMGDELEYLKAEIDSIAAGVADLFPEVDQRFALIVYRDDGDIYVTRTFDFTGTLAEFQSNLGAQRADGGGDYPEAMHLALEAADGLTWREPGTARVLFLVADAPPHNEFAERTLNAIGGLRRAGVAIYPVAASGVAVRAEVFMRSAALSTLSQYLFLTDDSGLGNSHAEPHIPCYHVQRLDQLMIRMISGELAGEALQPAAEDIIRSVGNPVNGVCMD